MSEIKLEKESAVNMSLLGVPVAIVIAGALIALAIYIGGGSMTSIDSLNEMRADALDAVNEEVAKAGPVVGEIRPVTEEDHIKGAASAKVTVIEYSDLECPFCKRFHPTMQRLVDEYPDDVRWVYRHFPLDGLHAKARKEAEATECAGEQGKFWEFTDLVFKVTPSNDGLNLDQLPEMAKQAGVSNMKQFEACLESGKYADRVAADVKDAGLAGGRGTPYSLVITASGEKLPLSGAQPYASVKQIIDRALEN